MEEEIEDAGGKRRRGRQVKDLQFPETPCLLLPAGADGVRAGEERSVGGEHAGEEMAVA